MKLLLIGAAMLLAGCASTRPIETKEESSTSSTIKNDYNRDMSECEREAVLSGVGTRAQAFDSCMRARNRTPTR
jgi:hypothetical protein